MIKLFSLLSIAAFVLLGVAIGLLNPNSVDINLFLATITLPLSVVMSALFVFGMGVGAFIIFFQVLSVRWKLHAKTKENQKLANQIVELKKELIEKKEQEVKHEIRSNSASLLPNAPSL